MFEIVAEKTSRRNDSWTTGCMALWFDDTICHVQNFDVQNFDWQNFDWQDRTTETHSSGNDVHPGDDRGGLGGDRFDCRFWEIRVWPEVTACGAVLERIHDLMR